MGIVRGPVPVWLQLANLLRDQIRHGQLKPGQRIPSIERLADEHGLAEGTVRKALDALKDEGLLVTTPGLGTFVAGR